MIFIIEHLDPKIWAWSFLEYSHISSIVGKENLWFTNVKNGAERLKKLGKVFTQSVTSMKLQNACILDSTGKRTFSPCDSTFEYIIFGGILGDDPETDKSLKIVRGMPHADVRNLGPKQMSTDTAVLVTSMILDDTLFEKIPFIDDVEIPVTSEETIILPYRYVLQNGKPLLTPGLEKKLKTQKGF
jgi:ribosome biogenesis SPOUT family RNA methylase Rps3